MTDRQGIEIDYCPKCRGVWLDRGELDKLIERSAAYREPPGAARGYSERDAREHRGENYGDHGRKRHPKKKESFLSDLFDF